jgi:hypothetical protein
MTEKSARAGVEAAKPSANTPTAKTKRFIESSPVVLSKTALNSLLDSNKNQILS